jgi:hypothetical protein
MEAIQEERHIKILVEDKTPLNTEKRIIKDIVKTEQYTEKGFVICKGIAVYPESQTLKNMAKYRATLKNVEVVSHYKKAERQKAERLSNAFLKEEAEAKAEAKAKAQAEAEAKAQKIKA